MTAVAQKVTLTYEGYLALEAETRRKHEYLRGQAWMMSGGTPRHSKLKTNLAVLAGVALGDGPCQAYDSDLKVRVPATGLATYPDLTIVCGALERHDEDPNAVTNPTVLFEVLSESTERWDRGEKFFNYQQLSSLQHYVLISPDAPRLEVYTRSEGGQWTYGVHGAGDRVALDAAELSLDVDALYRNLPG